MKSKLRFILPILFVFFSFFLFLRATDRTIAPLDFYRVYPFLYEQGNAAKTHSSYLKDINDVYLPWKFYLSEYRPGQCSAKVENKQGSIIVQGIHLPGNACYPLSSVRSNLLADIFFPLRLFVDFFAAYDLSYFLLLSAIFFSCGWFFSLLFPSSAWFLAAAFTASFPLARELQFDGLSQCWPYIFLSLGCAFSGMKAEKRALAFVFLLASVFFLFIGLWRSTLQGLGLLPFFWGLALLFYGPGPWKKRLAVCCAVLPFALALGIYAYVDSMQIFFLFQDRFLVETPVSFVYLRRAVAYFFSWGQFFFGELLTGFNTLDLSKSIRPLGARDHYSYDGASFFLQPYLAICLAWFVFCEWKDIGWRASKPLRILFAAIAIDFLVSVSPLYRLFYFRFHQWWMLFSVLIFLGSCEIDLRKIPTRIYLWSVAALFSFCQLAAIAGHFSAGFLLDLLGRQGVLGFEVGAWESRMERWIWRAHGLEFYALVFWVASLLVFYIYRSHARFAPTALLISGLALNTFHFNWPHSTKIFIDVRNALVRISPETVILPKDPEHPPTPHPQNLWLLVNKPAVPVHESLAVPAREGEK
jgi:hypothetical protein